MFEYADIYMKTKPKGIKYVILNVYGGESLHHPDIVKILETVHERYQPYQDSWHLTVTTTTNAIVSAKKLGKIIPLIDEFTVSYHADNTQKQQQQFKDNLLTLKSSNKRQKCIVLMHGEPDKFADAQNMIEWLSQQNIKYLPRQLDNFDEADSFNYNQQQVIWFESLYKTKLNHAETKRDKIALSSTGRACCGGRQLCSNQQHKEPQKFVPNIFTGWHCSVNHFFLYIKQVNGEVFVNKDCKMNFDSKPGPIGTLADTNAILQQAHNPPIIQCANPRCYCGLCAPKAQDLDTYKTIMKKYEIPTTNLLHQT
jgi:hypothetical protein